MIAKDKAEEEGSPSAVQVYVRVRPFIDREKALGEKDPIVTPYKDSTQAVQLLDPHSYYKPRSVTSFDECWFSMPEQKTFPFVSQDDIYLKTGSDACANVFAGYNSCIFAYGQTGSGKTYTMMGDIMNSPERGIIPRVCESLLSGCASSDGALFLQCTYYEIYNERVVDLLDRASKEELKVRNDPVLGPYVEGLSSHRIRKEADVMHLLNIGNKERHTAHTKMNKQSSRSHAVLTLQLFKRGSNTMHFSKLNLVDLAGSERTSVSEVQGVHFKEATKINLSLTTLGRVIDALADQASGQGGSIPPYRESLLTWLLSDSLGGNSKTCMIATVSPASVNFEETLNTLRYASRAREIINICVTNDDPYEKRVKELSVLVEYLRRQLAARDSIQPIIQGESMEISTGSTDPSAVSHYQAVISKLHHQVSKLSQENDELHRKLKDEKTAHAFTIKRSQEETATMRKELQMLHSVSPMDVLSVKRGEKRLDLQSVGRNSYESESSRVHSSRGTTSPRSRLSVPRNDLSSPRLSGRPSSGGMENVERSIERYVRELNRLQKEFCAKGNEIIEIHANKLFKPSGNRILTKIISWKSPRQSAQNSSVGKTDTKASQKQSETRESQLIHQYETQINVLKESHDKEMKETSIEHDRLRAEDRRVTNETITQHEAIIEQHKQRIAAVQDEKASTVRTSQTVLNENQFNSLLALEDAHRTGISMLQATHFHAIRDSHQYVKKITTSYTARTEELKLAHEKLRKEISQGQKTTEGDHRKAIQALKVAHSTELQKVIEARDALTERMQHKHSQALAALKEEHQNALNISSKRSAESINREVQLKEALEKEFRSEMLKVKEESAEKVASIQGEYATRIEQIEEEKEKEISTLKKEFADRESALVQKQVDNTRKLHSDTSSEMSKQKSEFEETMRATQEKHKEELAKNKAQMTELLRNAQVAHEKTQAEALKAQTETLKSQSTVELDAMRKDCEEKLRLIKHEHNQALATLKEEHQNVLNDTSKRSNESINKEVQLKEALEKEFRSEMLKLKEENVQKVLSVEEEYTARIELVKKESEKEISTLKQEFADRESALVQKQVDNTRKLHSDTSSEMARQKSEFEEIMRATQEKHKEDLAKHKAQMTELLRNAQVAHEKTHAEALKAQTETLKSQSTVEIDAIQKDCEEKIQSIQHEHNQALTALKEEHQNALQSNSKRSEENIEKERLEYNSKEAHLKEELQRQCHDEIQKVREENAMMVSSLEEEYIGRIEQIHKEKEKEISTLKQEFADRESSLVQKQVDNTRKIHTESSSEIAKLKAEFDDGMRAKEEKHKEELATAKTQMAELLRNAQAAHEKTQAEALKVLTEKLKGESNVELDAIRKDSEEKLQTLQHKHSQVLETLREEHKNAMRNTSKQSEENLEKERLEYISKKDHLKEELQKQFNDELLKVKEENAQKVASIQGEYSTRIEQIQQEREKEILALKQEFTDREGSLVQKQVDNTRKLHSEAASEMSKLNADFDKKIAERDEVIEQHKQRIAAVQDEKASTVRTSQTVLNENQFNSLLALEDAHRTGISMLQATHFHAIRDSHQYVKKITTSFAARTEELKLAHEKLRKEIADSHIAFTKEKRELVESVTEEKKTAENHQSVIEALKLSHSTELKTITDARDALIGKLQQQHKEDLAKNKAQLAELLRNAQMAHEKTQAEALKVQTKKLKGESNAEMDAIRKDYEDKIQSIQHEQAQALAALKEEHQNVLNDTSKRSEENIKKEVQLKEALEKEFRSEMLKVKEENAQKVASVETEYTARIEQFENKRVNEIALLKQEFADREGSLVQKQVDNTRKLHSDTSSEMSKLKAEFDQTMRAKEEKHKEELATAKTQMAELLRNAHSVHEKTQAEALKAHAETLMSQNTVELDAMRTDYESKLETMQQDHKEEMAKNKAQLAELLRNAQIAHEKTQSEALKVHTEKLEAQGSAELNVMRKGYEKKLENMKHEYTQALATLKKEHQNALTDCSKRSEGIISKEVQLKEELQRKFHDEMHKVQAENTKSASAMEEEYTARIELVKKESEKEISTLKQEFADRESSLVQKQMDNTRKIYTESSSEIAKLKGEFDESMRAREQEHNQDLAKNKAQMTELLRNAQAAHEKTQAEALKVQAEKLKCESNTEMDAIRKDYEDKIQSIQHEQAQALAALKEEHQNVLNDTSKRSEENIKKEVQLKEALEKEFRSEMLKVKEESAEKVASIQGEYATRIEQIEEEKEKEISTLKKEFADREGSLVQKQVDNTRKIHTESSSEIAKLKAEFDQTMRAKEEKHKEELTTAKTQMAELLRNAQSIHEKTQAEALKVLTEKLKGESNAQVDTLQKGYDEKLESIKHEHAQALTALKAEHQSALNISSKRSAESINREVQLKEALEKEFRSEMLKVKEENVQKVLSVEEEYTARIEHVKKESEKEISTLKQEFADRESALVQKQVDNTRKLHSDTSSEMSKLKAEFDEGMRATEEKHKEELATAKAQMAELLRNAQAAHEKTQAEALKVLTEKLKGESNAQVDTLQKGYDEKLESIKHEHAQALTALKAEHQNALNISSKRSEESINKEVQLKEALEKEFRSEMLKVKEENAEKVASIQGEYATRIEQIEEEKEKEISTLKKEFADRESALVQKQVDNTRKLHSDTSSEMSKQKSEFEETMRATQEKHKEELAKNKAQMTELLRNAQVAHEKTQAEALKAQTETLKSQSTVELDAMRKDCEEKLRLIKHEHNQALATLKEEHQNVLNDTSKRSNESINKEVQLKEALEKEFRSEMLKLKEENAEKVASIQGEYATHIEQIQKQKEKEISTLKKEFADREGSLVQKQVDNTRKLRSESASEMSKLKAEFDGSIRAKDEKHKEELAKNKAQLAELLHNAQAAHEKTQAEALKVQAEKLKGESNVELDALRKVYVNKLDNINKSAISSQVAAECANRKSLVAMQAETTELLKSVRRTTTESIRGLDATFERRVETLKKSSMKSVQHWFSRADQEIAHLSAKYQAVTQAFELATRRSMTGQKATLVERERVEQKLQSVRHQLHAALSLAENEKQESNTRLKILSLETERRLAVHRELLEQKGACLVLDAKKRHADEFRSMQSRLEAKCESVRGQFRQAENRQKADQAMVRKNMTTLDSFLRASRETMCAWQGRQSDLFAESCTKLSAAERVRLQKRHDASLEKVRMEKDDERVTYHTAAENHVQSVKANARAVQALLEDEFIARERVTWREIHSLQEIYSARACAWHQRETKLIEAMRILETASEVASDSAHKQQSVIRQLESSIALYKVLQLEGELGMQSGMI